MILGYPFFEKAAAAGLRIAYFLTCQVLKNVQSDCHRIKKR